MLSHLIQGLNETESTEKKDLETGSLPSPTINTSTGENGYTNYQEQVRKFFIYNFFVFILYTFCVFHKLQLINLCLATTKFFSTTEKIY